MAGNTISPYLPSLRPTRTSPSAFVERPKVVPKVEEGVDSLSLESKIDLSHKAGATPQAPASHTKKPAKEPKKQQAPQNQNVEAQDYTGRIATGTLHGPLLMEDPALEDLAAGDAGGFRTVDFRFDGAHDFQDLRTGSVVLGSLPAETLHAPVSETPTRHDVEGSSFSYYGVKNGVAVLIQHFEPGSRTNIVSGESMVGLPDGSEARITRGENDVTLRLPAASLDGLAEWGRTLLAVA